MKVVEFYLLVYILQKKKSIYLLNYLILICNKSSKNTTIS